MISFLVKRRRIKLSFDCILDQTTSLTQKEAKFMFEAVTGLNLPWSMLEYADCHMWDYVYSEIKMRLLGTIIESSDVRFDENSA